MPTTASSIFCLGTNDALYSQNYLYCDTQAEADSVRCALDPTAAGCVQEQDTTLYYCKQEYSTTAQTWRAYIFKCSCKQAGGTITGCNGKQNVDVVDDCTPYKALNGDCSQNGYNNGVNGDKDSTGTDVQCYAAVGADCIMRDRNSGNTFTCAGCDGSCDYAMRKIATGECRNPYPPPQESGDTLTLPPDTSGYQPPPWSSSSEDTPLSSFGEDLDALNGLYGVLDTIRDTLNGVAEDVRYIRANTQDANEYLSEIAAKDWNPTINVSAPNVSVAGDTNIINVNVEGGDTSRAPAAIFGLLSGALEGGQPQQGDTAGFGAREAGLLASIDSLLGEGVPDMSDSIGGAVQGVRGAYGALKDTLANSAWNDSVSAWQGTLLNNGVLSGNGSDNCPAVLQRTWNVTLYGSAAMQFGPLGKYLCATLPFMGVTFWALARVILRAVVSILCMVWIFKAVMGIDGGSSEED